MNTNTRYKVILVFNLTKGSADEEILRSKNENSFPNMLSREAGFIDLELVKINEEKTMSIQTWETENHWWTALEAVKGQQEKIVYDNPIENILVSREFFNGYIITRLVVDEQKYGPESPNGKIGKEGYHGPVSTSHIKL